jgi:3-methyladenine DNA glycosylase AlkD
MVNGPAAELRKEADAKKAKNLQRFFKTGKGEYAEGDLFLGVMVPQTRKIAKKYVNLDLKDLKELISSKFHEERLASLLILVFKFEKADMPERRNIFDFYIENRMHINNWDLIDLTAPKIVGAFLEDKDRKILYKFARSENIWEKRIALLSTFFYIQKGDCKDAMKIVEILKRDKHDLIQKAAGWMLREVGKRCGRKEEEDFLKKNYKILPRTMLRYAIEKFSEKDRKFYLYKEH